MTKKIVVVLLAVLGTCVAREYEHHEQHDDLPAHYSYKYEVQDHKTEDLKDAHEEREGEVTRGEYSLIEPDGTKRVVKYTVDGKSGFNAIVTREGKNIKESYNYGESGSSFEHKGNLVHDQQGHGHGYSGHSSLSYNRNDLKSGSHQLGYQSSSSHGYAHQSGNVLSNQGYAHQSGNVLSNQGYSHQSGNVLSNQGYSHQSGNVLSNQGYSHQHSGPAQILIPTHAIHQTQHKVLIPVQTHSIYKSSGHQQDGSSSYFNSNKHFSSSSQQNHPQGNLNFQHGANYGSNNNQGQSHVVHYGSQQNLGHYAQHGQQSHAQFSQFAQQSHGQALGLYKKVVKVIPHGTVAPIVPVVPLVVPHVQQIIQQDGGRTYYNLNEQNSQKSNQQSSYQQSNLAYNENFRHAERHDYRHNLAHKFGQVDYEQQQQKTAYPQRVGNAQPGLQQFFYDRQFEEAERAQRAQSIQNKQQGMIYNPQIHLANQINSYNQQQMSKLYEVKPMTEENQKSSQGIVLYYGKDNRFSNEQMNQIMQNYYQSQKFQQNYQSNFNQQYSNSYGQQTQRNYGNGQHYSTSHGQLNQNNNAHNQHYNHALNQHNYYNNQYSQMTYGNNHQNYRTNQHNYQMPMHQGTPLYSTSSHSGEGYATSYQNFSTKGAKVFLHTKHIVPQKHH